MGRNFLSEPEAVGSVPANRRTVSIEDAPLNSFHWRVALFTDGGMFCDGYIMGSISIALSPLTTVLGLSSVWQGLIGSATLIGLLLGAVTIGWITDIIGRKWAFMSVIALMLVFSLLQYVASNAWQLFVMRFILGVAIGGEYAIGAAYMAEYLPKKIRGTLLASLNAVWTFGFVVAIIVTYIMFDVWGNDIWRLALASSAIPAFMVFILRWGCPESCRWLISKGRKNEAKKIINKYIGSNVVIYNNKITNTNGKFSLLFSKKWRSKTIFTGVFWVCQVMPFFALITFAPVIYKTVGSENSDLNVVFLNIIQLIGAIIGVWLMDKVPRRKLVIWTFAVLFFPLFILGLFPDYSISLLIVCFSIYMLILPLGGDMEYVYPSEIFPTHIRAAGVGLATSISRVGAALGTFLIPISIANLGVGSTMLAAATITAVGFFVSLALAPETRFVDIDGDDFEPNFDNPEPYYAQAPQE